MRWILDFEVFSDSLPNESYPTENSCRPNARFIWREDLERELALVFLPCGCGCVVLLNGCVFSCLRVRVCEFVCCTCLVMVLRHIVQATCACIRKLNGISRHDCMMIVLLLFLQKQSFSRSHVMIIYLRHSNECSLYVGNKQQPLKPF